MIKVLARPTNNAEQFCGQRKEANLSANTLAFAADDPRWI